MQGTHQPVKRAPGQGRRSIAGSIVLVTAQVIIVLLCVGVMNAALETNNQVFTETMESDRRETWLTAVIVMAVVAAGALAYALVRRSLPLVVFEVAAVVIVVLIAAHFHHAIPVPPGTQSPGIGP
jgi:dolichol kinase